MTQQMQADQRIRAQKDFRLIFKKGKMFKGAFLQIWYYNSGLESSGLPKLGVVISRKVSARATQRNLWKRRIREAFRRTREQLQEGSFVVVKARHQKKVPAYREIKVELENLLRKTV